MPSWSAENEVKLLLTVIKTTNPKISRATWEEIAVTMGAGYTFEAVRQKYQNLKRDSEALNRGPATSDVTKATNSAAAKSKTTPNSTTDKGKTATANKKRKAASAATDDEEEFVSPAKVRKLKVEKTDVDDKNCIPIKSEAEVFGNEINNEA